MCIPQTHAHTRAHTNTHTYKQKTKICVCLVMIEVEGKYLKTGPNTRRTGAEITFTPTYAKL